MAIRAALALALLCAPASLCAQHGYLRSGLRDPQAVEVPTAGEAVGAQAGVDVPNPHAYVGALVGGGLAGTVVTIAIFCIASYFAYKWNKEMDQNGDDPHCSIFSCLCCLCCTPK